MFSIVYFQFNFHELISCLLVIAVAGILQSFEFLMFFYELESNDRGYVSSASPLDKICSVIIIVDVATLCANPNNLLYKFRYLKICDPNNYLGCRNSISKSYRSIVVFLTSLLFMFAG